MAELQIARSSLKTIFYSVFFLVNHLSKERSSGGVRSCAPQCIVNMQNTAEVLCVHMYIMYVIQMRFYSAIIHTDRLHSHTKCGYLGVCL